MCTTYYEYSTGQLMEVHIFNKIMQDNSVFMTFYDKILQFRNSATQFSAVFLPFYPEIQ